jgi:hypothetical protein
MRTTTDSEAWDALRAALARMTELAEAPSANLVALGKAYAALAAAVLRVAESSGQTSARFAAVKKALDLKTPRSALEAFLSR